MNSLMKLPMRELVINTGSIIALVAATGSLSWLSEAIDLEKENDKGVSYQIYN